MLQFKNKEINEEEFTKKYAEIRKYEKELIKMGKEELKKEG